MKKKLFLYFILCYFNSYSQYFEYAAKGGLNFASVFYPDKKEDIKIDIYTKMSFHIGATAIHRFNTKYQFELDILYSREGGIRHWVEKETSKQIAIKEKTKVNYLTSSLLFKMGMPYMFQKLTFDIGPKIGLKINANQSIKKTTTTFHSNLTPSKLITKEKYTLKHPFFNPGLIIGLSYFFEDYDIGIGAHYSILPGETCAQYSIICLFDN